MKLLNVSIGLLTFLLMSNFLFAQKIMKPNENLITKNIPDIPYSVVSDVQRYTESRSAFPVDWHPVKREMLITTRFGNTSQLHYIKFPGGARTQLTFFEEPVGNATFEPLTGKYFIFNRDAGGNEFSQLYRYDIADGNTTLISDGGRSQNGNVRWSSNKKRISFASTRRNGADRDIYIMDPLDTASAKMVMEVKGGGWAVHDWSPDDTRLIVQEELSVNEATLYILDIASGQKTKISPVSKSEPVASGNGRFSADGNFIFFVTDMENEFKRLSRLNIETKEITYITSAIKWDVAGFNMKEDGSKILFLTNEGGISKVYLLDVATLKFGPVKNMPEGSIGSVSWRPVDDEFSFTCSSAKTNADVYTHNFSDGKTERWTESELGGIVSDKLREPELIKWKSFDGLEISGFLYKPSAKFTGKRPVLVVIHGGPEGQAQPGFQGRNNYFLEELGIAIITPNVRGSTGFGKNFVKLDNGKLRENSVKDIGALFDLIATRPDMDASRIMVMGGSYGGYMALAVSVTYADKIKCAVDIVGISNFNTFLKNTESYRRDLRRVEYGNEQDPDMAAFLEKISPNNNAAKIKKPLFIIQGGNDPRVPRTEAEQMFNTLSNAGNVVWYLEAKDEGHGFRKKINVDFQFYSTVEFIKKYL